MTVRPVNVALAVLMAILGMVVGACGGGPASTASGPVATRTVTVTANPSTAAAPASRKPLPKPKNPGDRAACDQMQTVMAKMSKAASGWAPANRPFDKTVGLQIRQLTDDMAASELSSGTARVRAGLHQSTVAFTTLARAMAGTRKDQVLGAVVKTQVAYREFQSVCGPA